MTGDQYVQSVIDEIPPGLPLRDHIVMELRAHLAERTAQGQPLDDVLRRLGDPERLAESYLASVPLERVPNGRRLLAKIVDAAAVCLVVASVAAAIWFGWKPRPIGPDVFPWLLLVCVVGSVLGFVGYTTYAEFRFGRTIGKKLLGIRVVRESGTRITFAQALLRQLTFFAQFFLVDALFVLFNDKHQRAFELITKTRAVAAR
jgi:uncharacterized RDD family membrane protein YckC